MLAGLLFSKEEVWKKKSTTSCFDVTMGSYDGAEICELIGVYILSHLETIINKNKMRLYSDDGLLILWGANGQKTNETRKNIIEIFKNIGFKIDIVTNLKEVNFLDDTFILTNGTFSPYKKPNDKNVTALSSYLREMKKKASEIAKLTWSILKIVPRYSNISKRCILCLHEKLYIATYHD